jgi:hypothetical protein
MTPLSAVLAKVASSVAGLNVCLLAFAQWQESPLCGPWSQRRLLVNWLLTAGER